MDYEKHYTLLCERSKDREPEGYFERHHVIPKCLGGTDDPQNIVKLTPEEHYLAHQLLVKMHPDHSGLIWAAIRMTHHHTESRTTNKLYGWLRHKNQKAAKSRKGEKNGSFGKYWYHNPDTLENVKCIPDEVPEGFIKGRRTTPYSYCKVCSKRLSKSSAQYCREHFVEKRRGMFVYDVESDLIESLHERYKNGESLRSLSKEVPFSHVTLYNRFGRLAEMD